MDQLNNLDFVKVNSKEVTILAGKHKISQSIYIPANYTLNINPGAQLEFLNGSGIISKSPIQAIGSSQQPIIFYGANSGFLLINQSPQNSNFKHCSFVNLKNLSYHNFQSPSAITLSNSKVSFDNCQFSNMDSKHTIFNQNGDLSINHCRFEKCKSAVKSEYGVLSINNTTLSNITTTAIHMKSGRAELKSNTVHDALGTVIWATDNASIYTYNLKVKNGYQVAYAKSHSQLDFNKIQIENIEKAFEVYTSEAPHTSVSIKNLKEQNVKSLYIVQPLAYLSIDGKKKVTN